MERVKSLLMCAILLLTAVCCSCSSDDDINTTTRSNGVKDKNAGRSLYAVARQSADAPTQYKAEMALFTLNDIKSYNIETGELTFDNVVFDTHLFQDVSYRYRVYFYADADLLFDAQAVSWLSSVGYFDQLTFQCDFYGTGKTLDASESHFYLRYGYPGTIQGDETIEQLKQKNAAAMEHFISILRYAGKIVDAE